MTSDWQLLPFGDLTVNLDAVRVPVKKSDRRKGPYPYYGASGIVDHVDGHLFDGEYLLLAEDGENLRTQQTPIAFLASGKFWVNNHAHIVQGKAPHDTRFLMYALRHVDVRPYLTGSTMPKLTQSNMNRILLPVPPPVEQRIIASILGSLDDKIDLNRRMNQTLEAMAQALFRSWFVDFDPVRAKAEGRKPDGMDAETAALFPRALVTSGTGEIPAGWRWQPLDQVGTFLNGLALQRYPPKGQHSLPVLKIAQLRAGSLQGADLASADVPSDYIIEDEDLVFSWSGSLLVSIWAGGRCALNQHLFKVDSPSFPQWFVHHWCLHHLPEFQRIAAAKATTMGHIQRHHLTQAMVAVPPEDLVRAGDSAIAPLWRRWLLNAQESRTLAALRDLLLPKLLSGEMRAGGRDAS